MKLTAKGLIRAQAVVSYSLVPHVLMERRVREEKVVCLSTVPLSVRLKSKAPDVLPAIVNDFEFLSVERETGDLTVVYLGFHSRFYSLY